MKRGCWGSGGADAFSAADIGNAGGGRGCQRDWAGQLCRAAGPHCARLLAGHNRRSTSLLSGLVGSTLLLAADTIAKTVAATELPVSIFTSLLGVPFLLYLIIKPGRETR